ncbi:hypothetical protein Anas_01435, partial [Armadillidium nasatum]
YVLICVNLSLTSGENRIFSLQELIELEAVQICEKLKVLHLDDETVKNLGVSPSLEIGLEETSQLQTERESLTSNNCKSNVLEMITAASDICKCNPCLCDPSKGNDCCCNPVFDSPLEPTLTTLIMSDNMLAETAKDSINCVEEFASVGQNDFTLNQTSSFQNSFGNEVVFDENLASTIPVPDSSQLFLNCSQFVTGNQQTSAESTNF